ncbi:putative paraquat-inducible protein A [Clostridiales Family XIII bacterium PM5-7]
MVSVYDKIDKKHLAVCKGCGKGIMSPDFEKYSAIDGKCIFCGSDFVDSGHTSNQWSKIYNSSTEKHLFDHDINGQFKFIASKVLGDSYSEEAYDAMIAFKDEQNKKEYEEWRASEIAAGNDPSKPYCPKCNSQDLFVQKRGMKWGRAIATTAITGFLDVGAVAGVIGANKMIKVCNNCGHSWELSSK